MYKRQEFDDVSISKIRYLEDQGLLQPNEAVDLRIMAVSRLVNDVRNDGPELIEPASDEPAAVEAAVAPGLFD